MTAEKGRYLVAVAALRDKDGNRASDVLQNLAQQFSNNNLYVKELARLKYAARFIGALPSAP